MPYVVCPGVCFYCGDFGLVFLGACHRHHHGNYTLHSHVISVDFISIQLASHLHFWFRSFVLIYNIDNKL